MILTERERQTLFGMLQVEMSDVEELIKISDKQDAEELKGYLEVVKGLFEKVKA